MYVLIFEHFHLISKYSFFFFISQIFIHGEDLKSLHQQISPTILPEEFGGQLGPFDNSCWHASILANNEWCLEQRLYGYQKTQKS